MPRFRLSRQLCLGDVYVMFLLWYFMWDIMFVVATGTTISQCLGRKYGPVLSLSFFDVNG
jgi:hypothetical protein